MKKAVFTILAIVLMSTPAVALDFGYSISSSEYSQSTSNVTTNASSYHGIGVVGSGSAEGSNWAGGQASTIYNGITITPPSGTVSVKGGSTENFGEALGGFEFSIQTGNKNFLFFIPPVAGAIAGSEGSVEQWSNNASTIVAAHGAASSGASQSSSAGFNGSGASLLIGKNKGPVTGSFTGDSLVEGYTYSYSYKGRTGDTIFVGTASGAGNSAETIITGTGSGYASGSGQTSGGSAINSVVGNNHAPLYGSTSGMYAGQFSYNGNGSGSVSGYSISFNTSLPNGGVFGTSTGISVNGK